MDLKRIKKTSAQVLTKENGTTVLISYNTAVACHIPGEGFFKTEKHFSLTTSKQINQWLRSENSLDRVQTRPQVFFDSLC